MKIISGTLKGRTIKGFDIEGTRPTMDRVKESVFASIQNYIPNSQVLDLFAGTGNLGIEAISNGAKCCYFVDNNIKCIKNIKNTIKEFQIENYSRVLNTDYKSALNLLKKDNIKFDIIFIDPPYDYKNISDIVLMIKKNNLLNEGGILVLEFRYDNLDIDNEEFTLRKAKKYGDKYVYIYVKK